MHDILQWIVSTLAGIAVGVGLAKMQWRSKVLRQRRSVDAALNDVLKDAQRKFVPPPPHTCRFVFKGMGIIGGGKKFRAGYNCRVCKRFAHLPAHRAISRNDYFRKSSHD